MFPGEGVRVLKGGCPGIKSGCPGNKKGCRGIRALILYVPFMFFRFPPKSSYEFTRPIAIFSPSLLSHPKKITADSLTLLTLFPPPLFHPCFFPGKSREISDFFF